MKLTIKRLKKFPIIEPNRLKDAANAYEKAIRLSSSKDIDAGANFGLAEVYKKMGKKETAIAYYKKAALNRLWKDAAKREIDILSNPSKYSE